MILNAALLQTSASYRGAGISQYLRRTLSGLALAASANSEAWDLRAFVPDLIDPVPGIKYLPIRAVQTGRILRVAWEHSGLPFALRRMQPHLFHSLVNVLPAFNSCPSVVTVLDLSFERTPEAVPFVRRQYLRNLVRRSTAAARQVIAISQSTADDLNRIYGVAADRITVIPVPVNPELDHHDPGTDQEILTQLGLSYPFFLHVGTVEPRKNLGWLVDTFAAWHSNGSARRAGCEEVRLVLAGGRGWEGQAFYERLQNKELRSKVTLLGYVPKTQLGALYRSAQACVFPSRLEGFGMPLIEAMACGTPVLCNDTPIFQEIARGCALFFDTGQPVQCQELFTRILLDEAARLNLTASGLAHAAGFSEAASGQALLRVYQRAF